VPESRYQLALPLDRGFDPFGSASEQMCSVASTRRHLHILWDIQRSQHKGKKIFISLKVLVLERIIQVVIQGLSGLPTDENRPEGRLERAGRFIHHIQWLYSSLPTIFFFHRTNVVYTTSRKAV
jgi:hypothetical protein